MSTVQHSSGLNIASKINKIQVAIHTDNSSMIRAWGWENCGWIFASKDKVLISIQIRRNIEYVVNISIQTNLKR